MDIGSQTFDDHKISIVEIVMIKKKDYQNQVDSKYNYQIHFWLPNVQKVDHVKKKSRFDLTYEIDLYR